jgi:SdrD B-like domain
VTQSTSTDATGVYSFTGLLPGIYTVTVTAPSGYTLTSRNQGDDALDSDADTSTGVMSATVLTSGESDETWDAGLFRPVSLGNLVFEDFDDDGSFNGADQPILGAEVGLYGADGLTLVSDLSGATVATQTTGADGLYLFTNLRPGSYVVRALGPTGYQSSTDISSTPDADGDQDGDDNGQGAGVAVVSGVIVLTSGGEPDNDGDADLTSNLSVDFGFFRPAALGDLVWLDANRDGVQDAGEGGVSGVTVELWRDGGAAVITTTITAARLRPQPQRRHLGRRRDR